jgi:agmatine deiminase
MSPQFRACRRVAAEWEAQECMWIAWPHNRDTWPGHFENIPRFFANWIQLIAESLPVRVLAGSDMVGPCSKLLGSAPNIEVLDIPTNDCWVRDYGPTFVVNDQDQSLSLVDWRYNAWGGKYPPWDLDAAVCSQMAQRLELPMVASTLCIEGGAIEFDGMGRLLTTPCLLDANRNPDVTEIEVCEELHRLTGAAEVVWVQGGGLEGDDTDGHIDQLARFVNRENVVVCTSRHEQDSHTQGLRDNLLQLQAWAETTTPSVQVHELPAPAVRFIKGQAVPQSYCNFLRLGPDRLLVPCFGAPEDEFAAALISEISGVLVEQVDCRDLAWGLGALHCASRDQPRIPAT